MEANGRFLTGLFLDVSKLTVLFGVLLSPRFSEGGNDCIIQLDVYYLLADEVTTLRSE